MIVKSIDTAGIADTAMSKAEAQVLHDALTIAKLQVGPELLLGERGQKAGLDIEHMRGILKGIADS